MELQDDEEKKNRESPTSYLRMVFSFTRFLLSLFSQASLLSKKLLEISSFNQFIFSISPLQSSLSFSVLPSKKTRLQISLSPPLIISFLCLIPQAKEYLLSLNRILSCPNSLVFSPSYPRKPSLQLKESPLKRSSLCPQQLYPQAKRTPSKNISPSVST